MIVPVKSSLFGKKTNSCKNQIFSIDSGWIDKKSMGAIQATLKTEDLKKILES